MKRSSQLKFTSASVGLIFKNDNTHLSIPFVSTRVFSIQNNRVLNIRVKFCQCVLPHDMIVSEHFSQSSES